MKKEKKKKKKTRNTKNHKSNMKKSMKGEVVLTARQIQATRLNQLEYRRLQVNINSMEDDLKIHLARLHRQAQGIRYHYANVVRIVKPNPVYQLSKQGQTDSKNWLGWIISIFLEIFFLKNKCRDIFFSLYQIYLASSLKYYLYICFSSEINKLFLFRIKKTYTKIAI
jgi:hypothetical protein